MSALFVSQLNACKLTAHKWGTCTIVISDAENSGCYLPGLTFESLRVDLVKVVGSNVTLNKLLLSDDISQKSDVVGHSANDVSVQGLSHGGQGVVTIWTISDQLQGKMSFVIRGTSS